MERVIYNSVLQHLTENNILHSAQHGFLRHRSTCTNLLESLNDWTIYLQDKNAVTIVYIDFRKDFDSVSHAKLIARLKFYGIRGDLLNWLKEYLRDRTHCTRIGEFYSNTAPLLSGVIQGSIIGPLMFLCFINELIELLDKIGIKIKVFADDVKLYARIVSSIDVALLQKAIDVLAVWACAWQLEISIDKCYTLNLATVCCDTTLNINGHPLPVVESCRDLGVTLNGDLSPSVHIDQIIVKAHQRANNILRCFVSRDRSVLVKAFLTYVRPILEYNSVVWSPFLKLDIERIERVQRLFTRRLPGMKKLSYSDRMKLLNIQSLQLRRLYTDIIWCYKIIFGLTALKFDEFFEWVYIKCTRGHPFKLYKKRNVCKVRAVYFSERVVNIWNTLDNNVDFSSLPAFKRSLRKVDFTKFLCSF